MITPEDKLNHINQIKKMGQELIDNADKIQSLGLTYSLEGFENNDDKNTYTEAIWDWSGNIFEVRGLLDLFLSKIFNKLTQGR